MDEATQLIRLLEQKEKLVALLAPSFPVVYDFPSIVSKLKRLGFAAVVEVAAGARRTNEGVVNVLRHHRKRRLITSPCPNVVRLIRVKFPHLLTCLAAVDSPMAYSARLAQKKYPKHRLVFIGPCLAKKLEAAEDHPELGILVLTYRELGQIFQYFNCVDDLRDALAHFDLEEVATRLYPISGGLAESSGVKEILAGDEIAVVSGAKNCQRALAQFEKDNKVRLLDILFCEGGCINGPGIPLASSLAERRARVSRYWERGFSLTG